MTRRPPRSTFFPYTTLFRPTRRGTDPALRRRSSRTRSPGPAAAAPEAARAGRVGARTAEADWRRPARSEEHTYELQSRQYLVCRLLPEKKKRRPHVLTQVTQ